MGHSLAVRERLNKRVGKRCSVLGCCHGVNKFSQFCKHHDQVNQRTGHPLGSTITKGQLSSYMDAAREYLGEHQTAQAIVSARNLLVNYLSNAKPRRYLSPKAPAWQRIEVWRHRLWVSGVDPVMDILAVIVGMYLLQYYDSRAFKSDRHFWHQMVIRIFKLSKARKDAGAGHTYHRRVTVRERDKFKDVLDETRLLALGGSIARKIIQLEEQASLPTVEGIRESFG